MPEFNIRVSQVLRIERDIVVQVEAATAEEALELQEESDAPPNGPEWETRNSSVEHVTCKLAD